MADAVGDLASRLSTLNPVADDSQTIATNAETASSSPSVVEPIGEQSEAKVNPEEEEEEEEDVEASNLLDSLAHEIQVTLVDQQQDPNSPLFSVQSFEDLNLHVNLLKGVYKMGFQKPSKIQERALPLLLQNPPQNMIGQSQSGTGKTAAFALTMLSRIDMDLQEPQAICLAPTRELALQIISVVQQMGEYTPVTCFPAVRDSIPKGMGSVKHQIIVGTPGTIIDMITRRRVLDVSKVVVFVLDEADNMLDLGAMGQQSIQVKNLIAKFDSNPQIILFSATFSEVVRTFSTQFAPNANEIRLKQQDLSLDAIKQFFMDCSSKEQKYDVLVELYNLLTIGQSVIFVKTRADADRIADRMTAEGHKVISLHGNVEPAGRDAIMTSFREGKTKVLVATDVISRGIDVMQVNMVVNYDMPVDASGRPDPETYLHRIGRTGRFGRKGISISFVHDVPSFQVVQGIERALGKPMVRVDTADFEKMETTLKAALKK